MRHISIDDAHVNKMKPYMDRHNGNLCAALREIINESGKYSSRMNSSAIDACLLNWMLEEIEGTLVPEKVLDEILDPGLINSMALFENHIHQRLMELEWEVKIDFHYDSETFPSRLLIEIRGDHQKTRFMACLLSQYLVRNSLDRSPLEIEFVINVNLCIKIGFFMSDKNSAQKSLITFFGNLDEAITVIKNRPDFWKDIILRHQSSNYNMVTIHRNYLEDIFGGKIPSAEILIETFARKPVQEIPLNEMLVLIKKIYVAAKIVDNVDIDHDTLIISHNYRNKEAVERLKQSFVILLESNGHLYDSKITSNMIVLRHRPDVGIKINEMVEHLTTSGSTVDQVLVLFMAFLEGLREMPDLPVSLTVLGRRIGKSLLKEYEKEMLINKWDLETFKKAMETIDSRLHRLSEWKIVDGNLLYTIRQCHISETGNTFDRQICHTIREAFKGVLNQAFGNKAELKINKLLSHGDSFCEVSIRMP